MIALGPDCRTGLLWAGPKAITMCVVTSRGVISMTFGQGLDARLKHCTCEQDTAKEVEAIMKDVTNAADLLLPKEEQESKRGRKNEDLVPLWERLMDSWKGKVGP